jgi:predicted permease
MQWLAWLTTGIINSFRRSRLEREIRDELAFHLERRAEDLQRHGLPADEARRQARAEFGGVESHIEHLREAWGFRMVNELRQDVRHAWRMFARSPGFTAVAVLSVAIGIGANAAIFSVADALLLRPLPVRDPEAVVTVSVANAGESVGTGRVSYPNYRDLRDRSRSFDGLVAYQLSTFSFASSREAVREMRMGMLVSDNFFNLLGIQPLLGRVFAPEEGTVPDRDAVVVLGYDFWKGALAGDPSIIGGVVWVNGIAFKVIGLAPASFTGMDQYIRPAFFVPAMMAHRLSPADENPIEDRASRIFVMRGRLKPGVSRQNAQAELAVLWNGLAQQYPEANRSRSIAARSELDTRIRESPEDAMLIAMLMALVAIVLAIACANVANLMLGRARSRSREIAIRLALGVSRPRLFRQLLTESLLLAIAGGALGLACAYGWIRFLINIQVPTDLPVVISPQLDHRVLVFSLLATGVSALLFGLAPAWRSLQSDLVPALKLSEPGQTTRHRTPGRNVLVAVQVALSMVLLVATGTLYDGFRKSLILDPGFRTDHLLTMSLDTSVVGYSPLQTHAFYRDLADRARAVPGVTSVALTGAIPLDPSIQIEIVTPEGHPFPPGQEGVRVNAATVDEHYFETMKTEIVRGRAFTTEDQNGTRRVVMVNEEFAKIYWPSQDPIGKRLRLDNGRGPWLQVVGLTKTGKYVFIGEPPRPFVYLPFAQNERTRMSLLVETASADPAALAGPLRDVVRTLDANQPIYNLRTLSKFYAQRTISVPLSILKVVGIMGLFGLALALIGLYGLMAYSVACRTREIGIRMAIGAGRSDVVKMVLRQGLMLSLAGIVAGSVASMAVARLLAAGLAGLGAPNPATYVIVPSLLICLTTAASYFPARRASLVDPLQAVRCE